MPQLKVLLVFLVLISCNRVSLWDSTDSNASRLKIKTAKAELHFNVELAKSNEERQRGLMYREELPESSGMLFIFDEQSEHSFWMKNTKIPLDLIFFDNDFRIVGFLEAMKPYSTQSRSIKKPSRYVLEVNAGLVEKLGLSIGDQGRLENGK